MLLLCFYEGLALLLPLVVTTTLNEKIRDNYKSIDYQFSSSLFLPPRLQLKGYCETPVWILFSRGNWSLRTFQQVFKLWFSSPHIWRKPFNSCKERQVVTESEAAMASQKPFLVLLFSNCKQLQFGSSNFRLPPPVYMIALRLSMCITESFSVQNRALNQILWDIPKNYALQHLPFRYLNCYFYHTYWRLFVVLQL